MEHSRRTSPSRLALALLLAFAALAVGAGSAAAKPLPTGVTNTYETSKASMDVVRSTGASYVKIPLDWNSVVPQERPSSWNPENPNDSHYDWYQWDQQVSHAIAAGLIPVLQIGGAPQWAQGCQAPSIFPVATCDPDPTDLRAFSTAAARHFSGGAGNGPPVRYWQILNEPNLSLFFFPQFNTSLKPLSPGLYRPLINAAYAGIKAANPSDKVILAGLGPIAVKGYTIGPMQFARELLCMKGRAHPRKTGGNCEGGVHFDIFAIQPYTTGAPTHKGGPDDVEMGDIPKLQGLIKAADRAGRIKGASKHTPLWITEFSWDTKPPDPHGLPMAIETRWVAEALYLAWKDGVANFFWYSLHDAKHNPGETWKEATESGLYFGPGIGKPKEILGAFNFPFVALVGKSGLTVWGRTPTSVKGPIAVQLLVGGKWQTVKTLRAAKGGIFKTVLHTNYGKDQKGAARAVFGKSTSPAFAMKPVPDFDHPPFG